MSDRAELAKRAKACFDAIISFGWQIRWPGHDQIPDDAWPIDIIHRHMEQVASLSAGEGGAAAWKPIDQAPYLGEPFLAALEVHITQTKTFSHFDYAVLYIDEGRLHFYDDQSDTGWDVSDYTLCLPFPVPSIMRQRASEPKTDHPQAPDEEGLRAEIAAVLKDHYLAGIYCDHDAKTDKPSCACSMIDFPAQPSVGQGVDAHVAHVLDHLMPILRSITTQSVLSIVEICRTLDAARSFVEMAYEDESGEERADAKSVLDRIDATCSALYRLSPSADLLKAMSDARAIVNHGPNISYPSRQAAQNVRDAIARLLDCLGKEQQP